jgi:hypothetical protein
VHLIEQTKAQKLNLKVLTEFSMVFFSLSREMLGQALKLAMMPSSKFLTAHNS